MSAAAVPLVNPICRSCCASLANVWLSLACQAATEWSAVQHSPSVCGYVCAKVALNKLLVTGVPCWLPSHLLSTALMSLLAAL